MKGTFLSLLFLIFLASCTSNEKSRSIELLDENWKFINKEVENGVIPGINTNMIYRKSNLEDLYLSYREIKI